MTLLHLEDYHKGTSTTLTHNNRTTMNQSNQHHHNSHLGGGGGGGGNNNESDLLDKLQDMVPLMPRGRELSKLEIINYVIDYIRELKEMVIEE